jgi:hypothetical protein
MYLYYPKCFWVIILISLLLYVSDVFVAQQTKRALDRQVFEVSRSHIIRHTHKPGRIPLHEWSARRRSRYLHNRPNRRISMSSKRFEPAIPSIRWLQTYALYCTVTGIGKYHIFYYGSTALEGLGFFQEVPRSHSDTPHSVGLFWTSGQTDAETSTWQHTILTTDTHPCPRRDSSPQSQQASSRRTTP